MYIYACINRYDVFLDDTGNVLMLRITKKFEAYTMLLNICFFITSDTSVLELMHVTTS